MSKQKFIILGGLPGVGKTTLAKALAKALGAVYVRVDSIEQSIKNSSLSLRNVEDAGYIAANLIARDNLSIGSSVVADSGNPVPKSRMAWLDCAKGIECQLFQIELICSDLNQHKYRVNNRVADIAGHAIPTWSNVKEHEYEKWSEPHTVIDTADRHPDMILDEVLSICGGITQL